MSLLDDQQVFARTLGLFLAWMAEKDYRWTMGDCWRSTDELLCPNCGTPVSYQELLKYNGRSKTLNSKHNQRLACDINLFVDGKLAGGDAYRMLGHKWKELGGRWGGDFQGFPDYGHFEL
jgi:hypothetical protein